MTTQQTKRIHALEAIYDTLNVHFIGQDFTFSQFKDYYLHNCRYSPPILSDSTIRKYLESIPRVQKNKIGNKTVYSLPNFARPHEILESLKRFYSMGNMLDSDEFYKDFETENYLMSDLLLTFEGLTKSLDYMGYFSFARPSMYGLRASLQDFALRIS